jgi:hypothetical protein
MELRVVPAVDDAELNEVLQRVGKKHMLPGINKRPRLNRTGRDDRS